jgi:hypothetical protein
MTYCLSALVPVCHPLFKSSSARVYQTMLLYGVTRKVRRANVLDPSLSGSAFTEGRVP